MTAPFPQPEVSYHMYEQLRVQQLQLQREVAQIQQTLRLIQAAFDTDTASHTNDINSSTTTDSAQCANEKAPSFAELTTGISTNGFSPTATIPSDDSPIFQVPEPSIAIHDAAGIIALTNDHSIASSAASVAPSSKPSAYTFITTGNTCNAVAMIFISCPAPTVHPSPRPPPEPDPTNNTNTHHDTTTTITTTKPPPTNKFNNSITTTNNNDSTSTAMIRL